ncbi:MAG: hypothetical protein ACTTJS_03860 [Wolinella sp.]
MKIVAFTLLISQILFAHTAIMNCFDNGDSTITCEGGFSDGSRASGVKFVIEQKGKSIFESKFDSDGEVTFRRPQGDFVLIFDSGEGHRVSIASQHLR